MFFGLVEIMINGVIVGDTSHTGRTFAFAPARFKLVAGLGCRGNEIEALKPRQV